ncbi:MAG: hypothetical protein AAF403_00560, partial [Pseudomonadota bacterium]
ENVAYQYDQAVKGNERRLGIMVEATHYVIDNLIEKTRKMSGHVSRYNPMGKTEKFNKNTVPVTVNEDF